jgi:hypothetical protein
MAKTAKDKGYDNSPIVPAIIGGMQGHLSLAMWEPLPGREADSLATMRELSALISAKGYGHDLLYQSGTDYILLRHWKSQQAQQAALEDPELLRCWARMGNEIRILKVYEKLETVSLEQSTAGGE